MRIYKTLKLGIVGYGFVGKATDWGFNKRIEKFIVDPLLGTTIEELKDFKPDLVFICVPTPMDDDGSDKIRSPGTSSSTSTTKRKKKKRKRR